MWITKMVAEKSWLLEYASLSWAAPPPELGDIIPHLAKVAKWGSTHSVLQFQSLHNSHTCHCYYWPALWDSIVLHAVVVVCRRL